MSRPFDVRHAERGDDGPTRRGHRRRGHAAPLQRPGGIAHTSADGIAQRATTDATTLTSDDAVTRFTDGAEILRATPMSKKTVISYPVVGSTTLAVVAEVALMEATVHLLDLADAVGGVQPSKLALEATRDLLIAVPEPIAAIEVLAGRADPAAAVPAIR